VRVGVNAALIVLFVVAVGVAVYVAYYLQRKRRQELAVVAKQLGLTYAEDDTFGALSLPFALFRRGDGRGTENLLEGTWQAMPVREFDYWYYEETTDSQGHRSKSYSRFSCAVTEVAADLPPLSAARENVLTRIADSVGLDDIAFELEDFNRAFNVKSKDARFANDLVDQRMMRWLMGSDRGVAFETSGTWLLVSSRRRPPRDLEALLGTLRGFRDAIPRVVYDLYGPPGSG
jgi:hypothetical protein